MISKTPNLPFPSKALALEEFLEVTGVSPEHLQELIALEWIESRDTAASMQIFRDADVYRVRKLERICCDFELPVIGGTIIVDLLDRIDRLERAMRDLNNLQGQGE